jgi:hypothetical protein
VHASSVKIKVSLPEAGSFVFFAGGSFPSLQLQVPVMTRRERPAPSRSPPFTMTRRGVFGGVGGGGVGGLTKLLFGATVDL